METEISVVDALQNWLTSIGKVDAGKSILVNCSRIIVNDMTSKDFLKLTQAILLTVYALV